MKKMQALSETEKQQYLQEVITPNFMHLLKQNIFSVVFDYNYQLIICTELSAESIGFRSWQEAQGISYKDYANSELAERIFQVKYTDKLNTYIHQYAKKIFEIQQNVIKAKNVISFIDLLPYNGKFISYLVTYVPLIHPNGEVVALQSFANQTRFFSHQDYLHRLIGEDLQNKYLEIDQLTAREHEIMFLLANGINQDQIAQILKVSRSTIGNLIANQLCAKFQIAGSNTKLLTQIAIKHEYHQVVPPSLFHPYIIILDENLAKQINLEE